MTNISQCDTMYLTLGFVISYLCWDEKKINNLFIGEQMFSKFISVISFLIILSFSVMAQEDTKVKVGVFASASEFKLDSDFVNNFIYNPNITGQVLYRAGKAKSVKFYVGGLYRRDFELELNTVHAVGRVGYTFGNKVNFEPYIQFSAGTDFYGKFELNTFSREVQIGGEFNFGPIGITPLAIAYKRTGSFLSTPAKSYLSGVHVNF